jgi:Zn-dependent protease
MFTTRWRLFRLFGIPIYLDASWLIILALFTWTLSGIYHKELGGPSRADYWLLALVTALAFFTCIVLHEMGHALVARAVGMPIRGITLFLFGGVAELGSEPPSARAEFLMAIGGPVVSAVLAAGFWLLDQAGGQEAWPASAEAVFRYLWQINLAVLVFNLLPAFPLDGGRVLRSVLWGATRSLRRSTRWASTAGQAFAFLFILGGVFNVIDGNFVGGLWLGLIGLFLNNAARSSYQQVLIRQAFAGEPVRQFMNTEPLVVPPSLDLRHWVEDYVYRYHRKAFPVGSDGQLEGFISTRALADVPRADWERHTVGEVMQHDVEAISIAPEADALQALTKMQRTGSSRLLVTDGDRLVGIVSLKDLLRFLELKMELEGDDREGGEAEA